MPVEIVKARPVAGRPAPRPRPTRPAAPAVTPKPTLKAPPPSAGEVILRTEGLVKDYGNVRALAGVNVEVRRGEVMAFLGPNGAGKTTFTKCVLGLIRPTGGRVELFGQEVHASERSVFDRVGLVPDQYDFYGTLSGREHLRFYGRLHGLKGEALETRINEVLALVAMTDLADRRTREYSHGMKQRICIAQALLHKPDFVIFDEPTNGLDPRGAFEVRQLIKTLGHQGVTIFLSSHILPEVEEVCTRVAILSKGKVLIQSTVADLRRKLKGDRTRVRIRLEAPSAELERTVMNSGLVQSVHLAGDTLECELSAARGVPDVIALLSKKGGRILSVQEESVGLEQIFLELTKGEGGR